MELGNFQVHDFAKRSYPDSLIPSMDVISKFVEKQDAPRKKVVTGNKGQKTSMVWGPMTVAELDARMQVVYKPCFHPEMTCGEADADVCSCKETKSPCEKFCTCNSDCKHCRFFDILLGFGI